MKNLMLCCFLFVHLAAYAQVGRSFALMPSPVSLAVNDDRVVIGSDFRMSVVGSFNPQMYAEASRFMRRLSNKTGIFLDKQGIVGVGDTGSAAAVVVYVRRPGRLKLGEDESYSLETKGGQVVIHAVTDLGGLHALETLLQLVRAEGSGYYIPGVVIHDQPRFAWRGLLLDVALHFMPVDVVKRTLDGMAAVKMNVLHLHLCNDQGFRVESKLFPRLQRVASDGNYYTQEEVRGLVGYAAQRGIRIVPEFVVPAHTTAILTAYPEYASVKRDYKLQRYFGVFDPVMDPTNERLYPFLGKLFGEMAGLFPDNYFHIGGDENTGKDWESVPRIRAFMAARGMRSPAELQTYFNRRLLPILRGLGKTMIGWDEVLQPGLAAEVVIQSWRGNEAFYASLKQGHKAILSYGYYIDLIQPAAYHYANDPLPDSVVLEPGEAQLVLGGEATMWSELVTPVTVDSRIWPRTAAIAERLWSPREVNDVDEMYRRLDAVSLELEALGLQHVSYKAALMRQLTHGGDTRALEVLVGVLEPLKIYERNEGDSMYTVFSPFTKLADVASPDQAEPRFFNREVGAFLREPTEALAASIREKLRLWKGNDSAFQLLVLRSPVLGEGAGLSERLAALGEAGLEAMDYLHMGRAADAEWVRAELGVVAAARQQGGRCELQVVDAVEKLVRGAGAGLGGGQEMHVDTMFRQAYSVKFSGSGFGLRQVVCDRNGVVQVCSGAGVLRPSGGQLLYPGELVADRSYRPMADMHVAVIGLYQGQLVYATSQAIVSNGWGGKVFCRHTMPGVKVFCGGEDFGFLVADGKRVQYWRNSVLLREYSMEDSVKELLYDGVRKRFLLLGEHMVGLFGPTGIRAVYKGAGLTCFALADDNRELVIGTHEGYFRLDAETGSAIGGLNDRLPCADLRVIKEIDHCLWFGSEAGAFQLLGDGKCRYFASRRWLPADRVLDITAGSDHSVLVLTDAGLGEIRFEPMRLADKAVYFERQVRMKHIRLGFNATLAGMKNGDLATGSMEDSDNDGLWTSMYLGAEAFRYAATHSPEALQHCRESLDAMERLYTVNGLKGFPARSFERRGYAVADTQVWKHAPDSGWDWKSTTSSDEAIGHMFVYGVIAELVDDPDTRNKAIRLMDALMQHIVEHDLYLVDWNGQPTKWGKWNPSYVNSFPEMVGDRKINSSNIISMLQTAWHFTGKEVYRAKAFELLNTYGYLDNLMRPMSMIGPAPAGASPLARLLSESWNHSDDEMYFLGYWGLYRYALNDTLKMKFKAAILDHWQAERPEKEGAWEIFTAITGEQHVDLGAAVWYLQRYPLDLIDWKVSNSQRKDLRFLAPNFREQVLDEVLPPDELPINRHNANRFELDGGDADGGSEYSAGDIWLLPYWLGRYLNIIHEP